MKADSAIPDAVRRFILLAVPSVPYLEAMLLMRTPPLQTWTARTLAARLYVSDAVADRLLRELNTSGVIAAASVEAGQVYFRFAPRSAQLEELITQLAAAHAANLIGVTHLIHARLERRAQAFADSFKWHKDPT